MIFDKLNHYKIILASQSPRRQELLRELGLNFEVRIKDYDESYPDGLNGEEIAVHVAKWKAGCFRNELSDNEIVITADTIVWCNNKVLGKPSTSDDAFRILKELSGNSHEVITAVSMISTHREVTFSVSTKVTFEHLTDAEITYYINKFHPYDKAGAYGIQEWIGLAACSNIEGSYFNVVGMPVQRLYEELGRFIT